MSQVPTIATHTAVPRPSFSAMTVESADPTTGHYMAWLGGIDASGCSMGNSSFSNNHFGANGSKRTIPGRLGGGLT